jgi:hypothetical protein
MKSRDFSLGVRFWANRVVTPPSLALSDFAIQLFPFGVDQTQAKGGDW